MSMSSNEQLGSLTRFIEELQKEQERLSSEINFLLGSAIPQLEHEYLYCISLLEQEASRIQLEIARVSLVMRFYKEASEGGVSVEETKLNDALKTLEQEWSAKNYRNIVQGNSDLLTISKFSYEKEYLDFLLRAAIKDVYSDSFRTVKKENTELLRRISAAYREGNLGELRALRMIIEGKRRSFRSHSFRFSFKRILHSLQIRISKIFSL